MGAKAGEFFVELGLQGSDKTVATLNQVDNQFKSIKSGALEAKLAILGALYGIERYSSKAGEFGVDLHNFSNVTGQAGEKVQTLTYQFTRAGVSIKEMQNALKNISDQVRGTQWGGDVQKFLLPLVDMMAHAGYKFKQGQGGTDTLEYYANHPAEILQFFTDLFQKQKQGAFPNIKTMADLVYMVEQTGLVKGDGVMSGLIDGLMNKVPASGARPFIDSKETIEGLVEVNQDLLLIRDTWSKLADAVVADFMPKILKSVLGLSLSIKETWLYAIYGMQSMAGDPKKRELYQRKSWAQAKEMDERIAKEELEEKKKLFPQEWDQYQYMRNLNPFNDAVKLFGSTDEGRKAGHKFMVEYTNATRNFKLPGLPAEYDFYKITPEMVNAYKTEDKVFHDILSHYKPGASGGDIKIENHIQHQTTFQGVGESDLDAMKDFSDRSVDAMTNKLDKEFENVLGDLKSNSQLM